MAGLHAGNASALCIILYNIITFSSVLCAGILPAADRDKHRPPRILRTTGITLPQDQPYKIKHPLRALQVKNRSTLAVPPFMSSMMSSTLHCSSSHPFRSSIPKVQEEAKTKQSTRTRRTLAKMMVDLAQCVYCTLGSRPGGPSPGPWGGRWLSMRFLANEEH